LVLSTQAESADLGFRQYAIEEYAADEEPFYIAVSDEITLFEAAFQQKDPRASQGSHGLRQDSIR
jgi:hypothetical protein